MEEKSTIGIRSYALDALRGFAILTMILSGSISFGNLPAWMYHAQVPPPLHKFIPSIPGITWVDLVFPFFLFAMGAAFPLALSKKIKDDKVPFNLILQIFKRGLLLCFFCDCNSTHQAQCTQCHPRCLYLADRLVGVCSAFPHFLAFP
jgi:predicted acyltransferase